MEKRKYITLIAVVVLLAAGAFVTQQWFIETFHATEQEGTSVTFVASAESTVLDAMNAEVVEGKLSFSGRDFPGLGFFVEEINGKRNANGYYWILYVNGTLSQTGVSQTFLSVGDHIEWRYEKAH